VLHWIPPSLKNPSVKSYPGPLISFELSLSLPGDALLTSKRTVSQRASREDARHLR
jgi:hypothetical protein